MKVAVVDYGSGNLASASRAVQLAADRAGIAADVLVTSDPADIRAASRLVLPGQGAFADCMGGLDAVPGLRDALQETVDGGMPFLGICVGMQLMAERGLEYGATDGLGWVSMAKSRASTPPACACRRWAGTHWTSRPARIRCWMGSPPATTSISPIVFALSDGKPDEILATTDYGGPVVLPWSRPAIAPARSSTRKKARRSD